MNSKLKNVINCFIVNLIITRRKEVFLKMKMKMKIKIAYFEINYHYNEKKREIEIIKFNQR
jgi:hypothetical protein